MLSDWYWSAVISGDYSGSSDTIMSEDFRDIKNWFTTLDTSKIRRINRIGEIDTVNLKECSKGSSLYNAILSLIALNKTEDFYTLRVLDTGTYTGESIHDHHIFPKNTKGYPKDLTKQFQNSKDSIINRTLLLDKTNKAICSQKPSQYLQTVTTKLKNDSTQLRNLLDKHFISDSGL